VALGADHRLRRDVARLLVRRLLEHLQTTAPGDAEILIRLPGGEEIPLSTARVEARPGHYKPVVIVYLKT
jgi:hypothetical protein